MNCNIIIKYSVIKALDYAKATRTNAEAKINDVNENEPIKHVKEKSEEKKRDETATIVRKTLSSDQQRTKIDMNTDSNSRINPYKSIANFCKLKNLFKRKQE